MNRSVLVAGWLATALVAGAAEAPLTEHGRRLSEALLREADSPGKPAWKPMLRYLARLHGRAIQPPVAHLPYPYESIGPGYQGGTAFGHIDLTHQRLDAVRAAPWHVRNQTLNELAGQQGNGMLPGAIQFSREGGAYWKDFKSFPPLWVVAADACYERTGDREFLTTCRSALQRQITWFEKTRSVPGGGFHYLDATTGPWESGMDEGVRYDRRPGKPAAAVDACSQVYQLYDFAGRWSRKLKISGKHWDTKADALRSFIQTRLWSEQTGWFHDRWSIDSPDLKVRAFEGIWPVIVGAATKRQANRAIDEHLLNPREFFTRHPIATVSVADPKFELRMWRGPAWNCMTYWAARGCWRYQRPEAAQKLLAAALDITAAQFARTGTIWEFYHPHSGDQTSLFRKRKGRRIPCVDYLGHNPLFAMVDLWRECAAE